MNDGRKYSIKKKEVINSNIDFFYVYTIVRDTKPCIVLRRNMYNDKLIFKKTWRLINLCGRINPGVTDFWDGVQSMQWTDVIRTAVHLVVSVWYQQTKQTQPRGGWTWGAWSASVTSISTTGRTTYHVWYVKHFLP